MKGEVIVSPCLHMESFATPEPAVQTKGAQLGKKIK